MSIKKQSNTLYLGPGRTEKAPGVSAKLSSFAKGSVASESEPAQSRSVARRKSVSNKKVKLAVRAEPYIVGVWDIDVHAGFLYRVLECLNNGQSLYRFHPVEMTAPVGLLNTGERTRRLIRKHDLVKKRSLDPDDPDIADNALASDIFAVARPARKKLGLDYLVTVISPMIMDLDVRIGDDEIGWNFFSTSYDKVIIASAYDLRMYAKKAKRPFEACLAMVIAAQVLQETFKNVEFHDPSVGCVFDYCDDRNDIITSLKTMHVCDESLAQVPDDADDDVESIFRIIKEYSP